MAITAAPASGRRGPRSARRRARRSRRAPARRRCAGRASPRGGPPAAPRSSAASTASPWTLTLVCMSAARWRGRVPTACGSIPRSRRHARHLDAAVARQVVDQPAAVHGVGHVAVEGERLAGLARADDVGAVLDAGLGRHRAAVTQPRAQRLPLGDLCLAAARVLVERDVEALDEIGARRLDEPRHVLREVLGGLGDEVAQVAQHLVAHAVARPGGMTSRSAG